METFKSSISKLALPDVNIIKESLSNVGKQVFCFLKNYKIYLEGREKYVGVGFIIIGAHVYYWHKFSFWSRRNIKTPPPVPVFGNLLSIAFNPRQFLELDWPRKYGKLYGFYVGTLPVLVCSDVDVLKKICIKDFNTFPNHYFFGKLNSFQRHILIFQKDDHWRGMRGIISPTFSSSKIRIMYKIFNECCNDLEEALDELVDGKEGSEMSAVITAKSFVGGFTMGSAVKSFYGINLTQANTEVNASNLSEYSNTREGFYYMTRRVFDLPLVRLLLSNVLPRKVCDFFDYPVVPDAGTRLLADKADAIIKHRQRSPSKKFNDYLQLLLDAKSDTKVEKDKNDLYEEHHTLLADNYDANDDERRPSKLKLTEKEVSCQVLMLMLVATETTSSFLSSTLYILAHHPEVQEKLYLEVKKIRSSDATKDLWYSYEGLTSCVYLDCVVSESLRIMPPALFMDRVASEDYYVEKYNLTIPKGTNVNLPFYAIQRDPDYWSEPDKFDPDRFLPENKSKIIPGSYCPFGIGPRSCVGFRFALTEGKLALARLITSYHFDKAPGTDWPPKPVKSTFGIFNAVEDLRISVRRRN